MLSISLFIYRISVATLSWVETRRKWASSETPP